MRSAVRWRRLFTRRVGCTKGESAETRLERVARPRERVFCVECETDVRAEHGAEREAGSSTRARVLVKYHNNTDTIASRSASSHAHSQRPSLRIHSSSPSTPQPHPHIVITLRIAHARRRPHPLAGKDVARQLARRRRRVALRLLDREVNLGAHRLLQLLDL